MALVSPGIQISVNDQSQYIGSNVGSVPLVVLATAQDKNYNGSIAVGTTKANAGKLLSFTSQRDLVTAMGTPTFQLSSAGTPINGGEINEYGLLAAYSALGLGNRLFAIRADVDLAQLQGTSVRPVGQVDNGTYWLDLANTEFGLYELNATASSFSHINPTLITDASQVVRDTGFPYPVPTPKNSVGQQGSYALVFVDIDGEPADVIRLFYKTDSTALVSGGPGANTWVQVGSTAWQQSIIAVQGTVSSGTVTVPSGSTFSINTVTVTLPNTSPLYISDVATAINNTLITGVRARVVGGKLSLYVTSQATSNGTSPDGKIVISNDANGALGDCGLAVGTYASPYFFYGTYSQTPAGGWFASDTLPRPSGSIWWKTTSTGAGYNPALKQYSSTLADWVPVTATLSAGLNDSIYALDPIGGGINIPRGRVTTQIATTDSTANNLEFVLKTKDGELVATGATPTTFTVGDSFIIQSSVPGFPATNSSTITLSGTTTSSFVSDILAANIPYVSAQVNTNGTISIIHTAGGFILLTEVDGTPVADAGFDVESPYIQVLKNGGIVLSNFSPITADITYSTTTPYAAPADGTLWYYSNLAEVDIMVNDNGWKGYRTVTRDVRGYNLTNTDPAGVIVSASAPTSQSNGNQLVDGDLWLDSGDLVNYPKISRYNSARRVWVLIDNTDQISNNGIVFADARWDGYANNTGGIADPVSDVIPSIATLLSSNYVDLDCPDHRLYARGTLLFNTRRSGYNVKRFVSNYFNASNYPDAPTLPTMKDAWISSSGLKSDGSMYAGAGAQRAIVVAALKSAIDSNTDVLDSNYQFNLLVAPGYPELISNMVTLNNNRANTGFVIGDTPMTLAPNATDITAWNSNKDGGGAATSSPYLGIYYPAGQTNDLAGNSVAVPASHAVLRTFLYNDNVSYQWFAPAGVHRGLVGNLSDIGYVNANTGAFVHNGINQGLRDTLYTLSINPITQLPGTGIVVWGQETRSGSSTARNRVNVVRLENYLRTIFNTIANSFLFEPNDAGTRKAIATQVESTLHAISSKRGLYDFLVICDTSNNTSSVIANNQLYVDIAIEPVRDVEFIYIPIAIYNPGAITSLGTAST